MPYPSSLSLHEIWEEIAFHVDSTRDLLSLALTSRTFNLLIIPYHLDYRYISCDLRQTYVWEHLFTHLHRTKGVRSLEFGILDDKKKLLLPRSLRKPPNKLIYSSFASIPMECIQMVVTSISSMAFLMRFVWNCQPFDNMGDIFRAVTESNNCVQELFIDTGWPMGKKKDDFINSLIIWRLSNLTSVTINNPCLSAQQMLISNCPNLERLCLSGIHTDTSLLIFRNGDWAKLRRLTIKGNMILLPPENSENDQTSHLCYFLARHKSLQSLWLSLVKLPALPFMPNLLSIGWNVSVKRNSLSFLPEPLLSRIQNLRLSIRDIGPMARMESLETLAISISLEIPSYLGEFFQGLPNLRKLCVKVKDLFNPGELGEQVIQAFLPCPNLTHLFSTFLFENYSNSHDVVKKLIAIKTLKYFQGIVNNKDLSMILDRTDAGGHCGYRIVKWSEEEFGKSPDAWGDFFFKPQLC